MADSNAQTCKTPMQKDFENQTKWLSHQKNLDPMLRWKMYAIMCQWRHDHCSKVQNFFFVRTFVFQLCSRALEFKYNPTLITFDPHICFSHHPDVYLPRPNQLFPTATADSEYSFPWVWCKLDTFQKVCIQTNTRRCLRANVVLLNRQSIRPLFARFPARTLAIFLFLTIVWKCWLFATLWWDTVTLWSSGRFAQLLWTVPATVKSKPPHGKWIMLRRDIVVLFSICG